MEGPDRVVGPQKEQIVLRMHPGPGGFLPRYLLALTPLFLLALSLVTTVGIRGMVAGLPTSIPTPMGNLAQGMGDMVETLILLTSPVGIYTLFVVIGWVMRYTEMWAGTALALGLSCLGSLIIATVFPDMSVSLALDFLKRIGALIGPASVVSVMIVLAWTEKFRRSISYTITYEGLITKGGIWGQQERILPYHHIARLSMEQGMVGRLLDTGTIIPIGAAEERPGSRTESQEKSRNLLDCLYGIREPEKIMAVLDLLISDSAGRVEGQVPEPGKASRRP
jgi:membrane protein YdbS with pleckstrin-like domain